MDDRSFIELAWICSVVIEMLHKFLILGDAWLDTWLQAYGIREHRTAHATIH